MSVLWILGGGLYQRSSDIKRAGAMGRLAMTACTKGSYDFSRCTDEFDKMFRVFAENS